MVSSPCSSILGPWSSKLAAFKVEDIFSRKRSPGLKRTVFINENLPDDYYDQRGRVKKEHIYATNQVITSKYTIFTFLPRNILEQFRRIANIFFLVIAILQFFHEFSTISPGLVLLPLLIVLAITAAKDGYEDVKRHHSDRQVNHTMVRSLVGGNWVNPNAKAPKSKTFVRGIIPGTRTLRRVKTNPNREELKGVTTVQIEDLGVEYDDGPQHPLSDSQPRHHYIMNRHPLVRNHAIRPHWRKTPWEDLGVGDFVKVLDHEPIPADILICSTSEDENVAYVETKNLDGETNLKSRHAVAALTHIRSATDCATSHNSFRIECDRPDTNMYKLNAAVRVDKDVFPVDLQTMLLRGTVLRNTGWVIGIVLYTGEDTRIVMNAGGTPSKRSKVERQMNPQVFFNLVLLGIMAIICGIVDAVLEHRNQPTGALWLYADDRSGDNPSINGLITFVFALITFQNIVPISLYISIEFVRTCQAAFIYFDSEMYHEKTGQRTLARSWNLSDDLGQIEYIFSDKTGTLTQNSMIFRKCTIGGKAYSGSDDEEPAAEVKKLPPVIINEAPRIKKEAQVSRQNSLVPPTEDISLSEFHSSGSSTAVHPSPQHPDPHAAHPTGPDGPGILDPLDRRTVKISQQFRDPELASDLRQAVLAEPESANAVHARNLNGFFTVLALCHTVLTSVDPETGAIEYKAQSPDEAALVQAAADVGFVFRGRDRELLLLQTPFSVDDEGEEVLERYELLNVLEFTSVRKRMSVILRKIDSDDGRIFLLTKGADNVIFERLRKGEEAESLKNATEKHLDEFAGQGLRTLTLAYKVIGGDLMRAEEEYEAWNEKYNAASVVVDDRDEEIEQVCSKIEQDLRLLGATAIEDKLQDGVPQTIADLKKAGIKVWIATGDKLETAIAIGHSTNLISGDSNIIVVRGGMDGTARPVWAQLVHAAQEFFPQNKLVDEQGQLVDEAEYEAKTDSRTPNSGPQSPGDVQQPDTDAYSLRRLGTGLSSAASHGNGDRSGGFILVLDGTALDSVFGDEEHKILLLRLATLCEGVICCRTSPLQKALIVKLVKDGLGVMTLAVGDGANDVSMIQAADVGVGISGEEGLQAVNSSDYAIAQFRFLKRLLLVHGQWSYARNSNMILNFFYKNIVCIGVLWWFQIYCGWSSNYVFEYTYLLFWNSFWTLAPVIGIGLFDRVIDASALMDLPQLYTYSRNGTWFGMKWFVIYMFDGIIQSVMIYFLILYTYATTTSRPDGLSVSLYEFSTTMAFGAVFAANFFNGLNTSAWTGWVFFAIFIGDVLLWVYTAIYNVISPGWFVTSVYGNNDFLFRSAYYWLSLPLVVILSLTPRYLAKAYKIIYHPNDIDIIRFIRKKDHQYDFSHEAATHSSLITYPFGPSSTLPHTRTISASSLPRTPVDLRSTSRTDMSTGARSVYRGFDFSAEENGIAIRRLQSNLSERRASSRNVNALPSEPTPRKKNVLSLGKSFLLRNTSLKRTLIHPRKRSKGED